jgi:hypothetical protein
MVRAYWDDARIARTITNPQNGISAHVLDPEKHPTPADRERYIQHTTKDARAAVAKNPPRNPWARGNVGPDFTPPELVVRRASSYQIRDVDWLWENRFSRGKINLVSGHPDLGKSTVVLDIAARITSSKFFPGSTQPTIQSHVVLLTAEDDIEDTVLPRFIVAGGDQDFLHILEMVRQPVDNHPDGHIEREFSLQTDIAALATTIEEIGNVSTVIIDPVTAYFGNPANIDSHATADVRSILKPLQRIAAKYQIAVIAIAHLRKSEEGDKAMLLVSGSAALVAQARVVYLIVPDLEDDSRRLMLTAKHNIVADSDKTGLAYRIEPQTLPGVIKPVPQIVWEHAPVTISADQYIAQKQAKRPPKDPNKYAREKEFIKQVLANGPVVHLKLWQQAKQSGFPRGRVRAAMDELGVITMLINPADGIWGFMLP